MPRDLPAGTVTFLFTDVEGSTRLLHELGAESYADALAEHRQVVREACAARGGVEVDTQGDAFFLAFPTASDAVAAAWAITDALASGRIALRIGVHTGTPVVTEEGYVGEDVHLAARIAAAAHGGQIVVSPATAWLELDRGELEPSELVQALAAVSEIVRFVKAGPRDEAVRLAIALKHEVVAALQAHPGVPILGWSADALMAATLTDLAYLQLELGDTGSARRYAEEALEFRRRLSDPSGIAHALIAVATVAAMEGDTAAAYELQLQALANAGDHPEAPAMEIAAAESEVLLGAVDSAAARVLASIEGIRGLEHRVFVASVARVAGLIALARGDARSAARLLGAYAHILEDAGLEEVAFFEVAPDIGRSATTGVETARLTLGEEGYAREVAQAAELDDDEILDTAAAALLESKA